jgi:predicted PurR-regulated permease PerM
MTQPIDSVDGPTGADTVDIVDKHKRPINRGWWFEAGFFAMLGAIVVSALAFATWRVLGAAVAVAMPIVVGLALALLLDPAADKLEKRGLSRLAAVGVVFLTLVVILAGIASVVIPALVDQASQLAQNAPAYVDRVRGFVNDFLTKHHRIGSYQMPPTFDALVSEFSGRVSEYLQRAAGSTAEYLVGSVVTALQTIVALIVTFYLLLDIDRLRARLLFLAPDRVRGTMQKIGEDIGAVFTEYIRGLLIVCAMYGAFTVVYLYVLSISHHDLARYALLVGAVAGVLYAVPYVGALATALITFIVAFASGGLVFAGVAIALMLVLNQVFDNIITPRVVGGGVGLHPVVAIFALLLGGDLFGVWGTVLSVPIAASVQVVLYRFFPKLHESTPERYLREHGVRQGEESTATVDPSSSSSRSDTKQK